MFGTVSSFAKKAHIIGIMALISGVVLFGCSSGNGKSTDEGCIYETYDVLVRVKNIKPHPDGDGLIEIILDFKGSKLAFEDQKMSTFKPDTRIDHDFLVRNHIEIGNKYEATVSQITEGDCTPLFVSFNHDLN